MRMMMMKMKSYKESQQILLDTIIRKKNIYFARKPGNGGPDTWCPNWANLGTVTRESASTSSLKATELGVTG